MRSGRNHRQFAVAAGAQYVSAVVILANAVRHVRAAGKDERKGFPLTAAMEWREAAELFGRATEPAEYCWRQWERIMRLPRRLAGPVVE